MARARPAHRPIPGPTTAAALCALTAATLVGTAPAAADLRVCNATASRIGVAIGYMDGRTWVSEGWWNVDANSCEIVIEGDLFARFYYVYAVDYDQGGEWTGPARMCTEDRAFTIRGHDRCEERGYQSNAFMEVDTGEQSSWTVQLVEPGSAGTGGR